jgi:isoleucyl-tRNA synthetase
MEDPYITYYNNYIVSIWFRFKTIHEKGLLYKGTRSILTAPLAHRAVDPEFLRGKRM